MANRWKKCEVSELINDGKLEIGDGYRAKNVELASDGIPFARVSNISDGFHFDNADLFPEKDLSRIGNKISRPGDVVFTSKGTVGRFALVRENTPRFVYSPQLCFWRSLDHTILDPRFLYYWMQSREFFLQFKGVSGQTDMAEYVSLGDQRRMTLTIPEPNEQRSIVSILGALDDRIMLNRRMNKILEEISEAIFKHWFIEFEFPNKDGNPFKSSGGAMIDHEEFGRDLPDGWRFGKLGEIVEFAYGKSLPESNRKAGNYPVVGSNGIVGFHSDYLVEGPGIVIGRKGTLGEVSWIDQNFFPIDTTFYLIDTMKSNGLYFLYFLLRGKEFLKSSSDSAVPGLNRNAAISNIVIIPPINLIAKFNVICHSLFDKRNNNLIQSETLSEIRDLLLPKLMSGKIRVPIEVSE